MAAEVITQEQAQAILKALEVLQKQNAEMQSKMDKLERQQNVVQSFLSAITEAQDLGKTMQEIENVTRDITKADKAVFYCCDNSENKFFVQNNENRDYCLDSDSPENAMLSEMKKDAEKWSANEEWKIFRTDDSSVYIPIISNDSKVLGIVEATKETGFDNRENFELFKPNSEIINTIDLAIQKEINHQTAITDELTGLKNRDGLNEYLRDTMCAELKEGNPVNIIMCDIDHFKNVNDIYGHDAGDIVLKNVADILKNGTKTGADCAFRFGGEEIICIINGDADKAYQTAEELRRTVEYADNIVLFDREPVNVKVTVSMGLYQIDPAVGMQFTKENARAMFDAELKNADDLVYAAKNSGRNRIKTTADMYDSYLVSKSAEVIGVNEIAEQAMTEIRNCVAVGDSDSIIEAAESVGADEKDSRDLRTDFNNRGYSIHELDNGKIGNVSYMDIKPKYRAFINNVYESQVKRILPLLEEQGIKYSGVRNTSGNYTLTVNKYDVKKVKSMIFENSQERNISQDQKKEPKFYNKEAFKDIDNKTYIQTDSKTAYEISQEAQKDGVVFSAKFDGEKSAVTVDGQKDLNFINKIKSIKEWAEKVHVRAAPIKQRQLEEEQRKSRGGDAR